MVYCVVPRELSAELHEALREHFRDDPAVSVVVEMRRRSRRRLGERRRTDEAPPGAVERRRIQNDRGRRVADRRAATEGVAAPPLPPELARHGHRLLFLERAEPSDQEKLDAETKRLVARWQSGEEGLFDEIYLRHFGSVYGYAHAALRSGQDAEDAAQDVFVRALEALPGYEIRSAPFRAWLLRIARNVVLDCVRRSKRLLVEDPADLTSRREAMAVQQGQGQVTLDWLSKREVVHRVERLPRGQREVIVLRYLLDMPYEQIAGLTGQTPRAARHLHSRAIELLNG